jgi:tripartite-type tricarboxylate transporter receptor subunit TctC
MEPLIGDAAQARFNPLKFQYVGSANRETSVCVAWHTSPVKTFDDMFKTELIVGTSGVTSSIQQYPTVLNSVLGTKFKMITGYTGSHEAALAMERGETQGICGLQWSSFKTSYQNWLETKQVRLIAQISSPSGDPELNQLGVPKVWDWVKADSDRRTLNVILRQLDFGRPYVLPPNTPPEVVRAYRDAFAAVVKDPDFLAEAKKMALEIDAMPGDEVQKAVEDIYGTPAVDVERANKALKGQG